MKTGRNRTIIRRVIALLLTGGMMLSPVAETMLTVRAEKAARIEGTRNGRQKGTPSEASETDAGRQKETQRGRGKGEGRGTRTPSEATKKRRPRQTPSNAEKGEGVKGTPSNAVKPEEVATPSVALPVIQPFLAADISCTVVSDKDGQGVVPGNKITYTITVKNNASEGSKSCYLQFSPTLDSGTAEGIYESGTGWFDFSWAGYYEYEPSERKLDAGEEIKVSYTVRVKDNAEGVVAGAFKLFIAGGVDSLDFPEIPILSGMNHTVEATKSQTSGVLQGDTFDYKVTLKNTSLALKHIVLWCDDAYGNAELTDYTADGGSKNLTYIEWEFDLAPGSEKAVTYPVRVKQEGTYDVGSKVIYYVDNVRYEEDPLEIPILKLDRMWKGKPWSETASMEQWQDPTSRKQWTYYIYNTSSKHDVVVSYGKTFSISGGVLLSVEHNYADNDFLWRIFDKCPSTKELTEDGKIYEYLYDYFYRGNSLGFLQESGKLLTNNNGTIYLRHDPVTISKNGFIPMDVFVFIDPSHITNGYIQDSFYINDEIAQQFKIYSFLLESAIDPPVITAGANQEITYTMTVKENPRGLTEAELVIPIPEGTSADQTYLENALTITGGSLGPKTYTYVAGTIDQVEEIHVKVSLNPAATPQIKFKTKEDHPLVQLYFRGITLDGTQSPERWVQVDGLLKAPVTIEFVEPTTPPGYAVTTDVPLILKFLVTNVSDYDLTDVKVTIPLDDRLQLGADGGWGGYLNYTDKNENRKTIPYNRDPYTKETYSYVLMFPEEEETRALAEEFKEATDWEYVITIDAIGKGDTAYAPNNDSRAYVVIPPKNLVSGDFAINAEASVGGAAETAKTGERRYVINHPKLVRMTASPDRVTLHDKINYTVEAFKDSLEDIHSFKISLKIPSGTVLDDEPVIWLFKTDGSQRPLESSEYSLSDHEKPNLLFQSNMLIEKGDWLEIDYSVEVEVLGGLIRNYAIIQAFDELGNPAASYSPPLETPVFMPETGVTVKQFLLDEDDGTLGDYLKSDENGVGTGQAKDINFTVTITNKVTKKRFSGNVNADGQIIFVGLPKGEYDVTETGTSETSFLAGRSGVTFTLSDPNAEEVINLYSSYRQLPGFSSASKKTNYMSLPNIDFTRMLKYNLDWLANMQLTEINGDGNGAIPGTDAFDAIPDEVSEWREDRAIQYPYSVRPYFSLEAANAFLLDEDYFDNATRYLIWHLEHINGDTIEFHPEDLHDWEETKGTIYDYTYDFLGNEIVSKSLSPDVPEDPGHPNNAITWYDSIDSYAARLFELLYRYYLAADSYGRSSEAVSLINSYKDTIELIYENALVDSMVPLGGGASLTYADKVSWQAMYLMDNLEVYQGFLMADKLGKVSALDLDFLLGSSSGVSAAEYAEQVRLGVENELWNGERYDYAVGPDPGAQNDFYPGYTAQLFPIIFGLHKPDSQRAKQLWNIFCGEFPEWYNHDLSMTGGFPWAQMTYTSAVMGDFEGCIASLKTLQKDYQFKGNPSPMTNQEASTTILAIAAFMQQYYDKMHEIYPLLVKYGVGGNVREYEYAGLLNILESN